MTAEQTAKIALVTGAASGIGRAAALRLAGTGWQVAALDVDGEELKALCGLNSALHPYSCDITDHVAVAGTVTRVRHDLGVPFRLVHAAGIAAVGPLLKHGIVGLKRLMEVNYGGTLTMIEAVVPVMAENGGGQVVLFGSIGGWVPLPGGGGYGAAKAAVHFLAESLSSEGRSHNIQVVCVCPPPVETPMLDRMRADNPDIMGPRPGLSPDAVLNSMDKALARRRLWAFPGRSTRVMWVARRLAPRLLSAAIARTVCR
ncbi:SDR family oxidoreductase [Streptomyces sp. NBC_01433]|uniref:SDR family NAD(P)-dependent oxidoreductase n=1 Tax=Streptomyces sp. NBC_01433 TaxID=2903864 RepID=UPI00224FC409|nr:SDR family oxidoreductase [Streptomyces sp. NBC_01433]MCX4680954.1 SDR family oxidoreductase [Streptomyces sp. NBC_01433]